MNSGQKVRTAQILGYICIAAGALNLVIAAVRVIRGQPLPGTPLLVTGIVALSGGIFMLVLAKQKPPTGS